MNERYFQYMHLTEYPVKFHTIYGGVTFDVRRASENGFKPATPECVEIHNHVLRTTIELKGAEAEQFLQQLTEAHNLETVCRDAWFRHSTDLD